MVWKPYDVKGTFMPVTLDSCCWMPIIKSHLPGFSHYRTQKDGINNWWSGSKFQIWNTNKTATPSNVRLIQRRMEGVVNGESAKSGKNWGLHARISQDHPHYKREYNKLNISCWGPIWCRNQGLTVTMLLRQTVPGGSLDDMGSVWVRIVGLSKVEHSA